MEQAAIVHHAVLTRADKISLFVGCPLLMALLLVELSRVWRALHGEPLLITGSFGREITVQWTADRSLFILGMMMHAVILVFVTAVLWVQVGQARLWWRSVRD
jgi:hypothetical protein